MSQYSIEEVAKILLKNGYEFVGFKGSHCRFRRGDKIIHMSRHSQMNDKWVKHILKEADISIDKNFFEK